MRVHILFSFLGVTAALAAAAAVTTEPIFRVYTPQGLDFVLRNSATPNKFVSDQRTHLVKACGPSHCCDMTKRSQKAWTKWRKLVREQAHSGQTVIVFCRERGLCRPYFFTWKKRPQESLTAKVLEVQVTERASSTAGDAGVEI